MASLLEPPRTIDVASLAAHDMEPHHVSKLRALLRMLAGCDMGRRLLNVAADQRITLRLATKRELMTSRGPSGGHYDSSKRQVVVLEVADVEWQVVAMAHELQHFVDHAFGWRLGTIQCEVRAQQTEALVIQQLRLRVGDSWGITPSGQLRPAAAIADLVREHRLYRGNPEEAPRGDGSVHPLLSPAELQPQPLHLRSVGSAGMRVGAVGPIAITSSVAAVGVPTGPVAQAATSALGANTPTGWDPEYAMVVDTDIDRFLGALETRRLAIGA